MAYEDVKALQQRVYGKGTFLKMSTEDTKKKQIKISK